MGYVKGVGWQEQTEKTKTRRTNKQQKNQRDDKQTNFFITNRKNKRENQTIEQCVDWNLLSHVKHCRYPCSIEHSMFRSNPQLRPNKNTNAQTNKQTKSIRTNSQIKQFLNNEEWMNRQRNKGEYHSNRK